MATQQPSASPVFSYTAPALLSPPRAFGIVERGVYRSNAPDHPSQLVFLRSIGLRSIVLLSPEAPTRSLLEYLDENKIALTHLGMTAWKSNLGWKPVSEELIKEGIERVLDVRNHPIMVMCS
ncbi:hypothetical protein HK405_005340 [Cladochytrium tenue]|nr:hypothetical protein HK405_005340 [Cladochytrium tenue]